MTDWYKASLAGFSQETREQLVDDLPFASRRSPIVCRHAAVASSQPLASEIGLRLLHAGANAASAAVGVAAALAVTEPCSTGLGGDMFCLYYDAATRTVSAVNGSGKSPAALTRDLVVARYPSTTEPGGIDEVAFRDSPHAMTVPGAAQGWADLVERHGQGPLSLAELLEPAAQLAEEGFPVAPVTAYHWQQGFEQITKWLDADTIASHEIPLAINGRRAPEAGEILVNPDMARVLRELGELGPAQGFYQGRTGQAMAAAVQKHGGCLSPEDLHGHTSDFPTPLSIEYRGCRLWQHPPNGQGIAGLIALSGLAALEEANLVDLSPSSMGSEDHYHAMMEMMRLGFADARAFVADPEHMTVDTDWLLDKKRIRQRAVAMFDPNQATIQGAPDASSCTVSFQVVDKDGNAVSFVNSNYMGFGTGIVPDGCGFTLQNRGYGFTLDDANHPNAVGPAKRPYHTIIPGMLTHADTGELYATLSNMGGNMQPQGHLQLTVDMLAGGMDPQAAIDMPRFCIIDGTQGGTAFMEKGIDDRVIKQLRMRGHTMRGNVFGHERSFFGRAQIIKRDRTTGVLWAGSDGRADGCAIGY